jgi:hypothetical protein
VERREFEIRVRPHRVAVLLPWEAERAQCLLAIEFLSRLWGGRYCPIIPVGGPNEKAVAEHWLREMRPDVVYTLDVDHGTWARNCRKWCQSYAHGELSRAAVDELEGPTPLDMITRYPILQQFLSERPAGGLLRVVVPDIASDGALALEAAAAFGIWDITDPCWQREDPFGGPRVAQFPREMSTAEYIGACVPEPPSLSGLDVASYDLRAHIVRGRFMGPTIVLGSTDAPDVALFWNLRMQTDHGLPGTVMLFPAQSIEDAEAVAALAKWVQVAARARGCSHCELISLTAGPSQLGRLARRLRPRLGKVGIEHVDVYYPGVSIPAVTPYEQQTTVSVDVEDRVLRVRSLEPRFGPRLRPARMWILDLVRDRDTRRAPFELCPVPSPAALAALNAPFPELGYIHFENDVRYGADCIGVRVSMRRLNIQWFAPTDTEVLEATLREVGAVIQFDEKRNYYHAVLHKFFRNDLQDAARAMSGASFRMLTALAGGRPLALSTLKERALLGGGPGPVDPRTGLLQSIMSSDPARQAIACERFRRHWAREHPAPERAHEVLHHWNQTAIVMRCFQLPPCPHCHQEHWLDRIDLSEPVRCPGCASVIPLPGNAEVGYRLNPLISRALDEGIGPVVLAGRFLYRLTRTGFMWLPGVKGTVGGQQFDIDIVASCDGHLVFAECKTLEDLPLQSGSWDDVNGQLSRTADFARALGAELVVLASRADMYPPTLVESAKENSGEAVAVVLLNRTDLEAGRRKRLVRIMGEETERDVMIEDLLPQRTGVATKRDGAPRPRVYGL